MKIFLLVCLLFYTITLADEYEEPNNNKIELFVVEDTLFGVSLIGNSTPEFPNYIFRFTDLKRLNIFHCYYKNVPKEIRICSELEELRVVKCKNLIFKEVLNNLRDNNKLKKLVFKHYVESIPTEIKYLRNLEELILSHNNIKTIPEEIKFLDSLKILDLLNNDLQYVPNSVFKLKKLKKIILEGNHITDLKTGSVNNTNIEIISLANNNLKKIPNGLEKLKGLRVLNLSENKELKFDSICTLVKELPNLRILTLYKCEINNIPDNIENLSNLKIIYIISPSMDEEILKKLKSILKNVHIL